MNQQVNIRMDAETAFREGSDNGNVDAAAFGALKNSRHASLRGPPALVGSSADQSVDLVHLHRRFDQ